MGGAGRSPVPAIPSLAPVMSPRLAVQLAALAALFSANAGPAQEPPPFDASVDRPAYRPGAADRPRVLFDAAHNNTHLPGGNYRALVELLRNDGYDVDVATAAFDPAMLAPYDILVIATPQPFPDSPVDWSDPSITHAKLRLLARALEGAPAPVTTEGVLAILGELGLAVPPWAGTGASASG